MALNIDLKNLDLKSLPQQGKPVQLIIAGIVILAILAIAYFVFFSGMIEQIDSLKKEEETLKTSYSEKAAQGTNLEELKKELEQINNSFQVLLKQLPTQAEIPNLIQELHQAASSNGLRMDSITPAETSVTGVDSSGDQSKDSSNTAGKVIKTLPYNISLSGNYTQISAFVHAVGNLSRIVTLSSLSLKQSKDNTLTLNAVANTYQALSDTEIKAASQKEKQNDKK